MSELPAMSSHVQELISLTHSRRSAAYELSKVILKDYSLTNKVLQVVNSAFYSLGRPVSSISRAVTILGFDAVRDLAMAIALFEDFVKAGVEKEGITKILARSFLSALQARELVDSKGLNLPPEEAFICALLHNLGRIIVCIYLPDKYSEIERQIAGGVPEDKACRVVLEDLTFMLIGEEVAKFWNLSEKVVACMDTRPGKPKNRDDAIGYLQSLSDFTNRLVDSICDEGDVAALLDNYQQLIPMDQAEAVQLMTMSIDASEDISDSMRYGLSKLKIRSKVQKAELSLKEGDDPVTESRPKKKKKEPPEELDELPVSKDKTVNDFIREIAETLTGDFQINDFYINLLEALYRGVGFDRVILGIVKIQPSQKTVVGRFGLGDIDPVGVNNFEHPLASMQYLIAQAMAGCQDMSILPNTAGAFPENMKYLVRDRAIELLPICLDKKAIGLIYLDRKKGRPPLDPNERKAISLFRDLAVMAIQKLYNRR
ncbi:MAG: HDOD domain-containing protein [Proteobacteria bacterium]|nr:HDOD domain-containing protein [Pseudomonadota bacterium]MBU1716295.1 HDOD domain-containing protein [Pseudomonadota bacterium]